MKTKLCCLIFCTATLSLGVGSVWGEEPPQAELPKAAIEVIDKDHDERLNAWQNYHHAFLDVGDSLVSTNGLGIDVAAPEAALRAALELAGNQGLVIIAAPEESIGAKAGLKVHDVVAQINGQEIGDAAKLAETLAEADGQAIKLRILRGGKPIEIQAIPKKPEVAHVRWKHSDLTNNSLAVEWTIAQDERYRLGLSLSEADDTLRAHLRLAAGEGLVVTEVIANSAAAEAGIQQHDVLIVLDGQRLTTVEAVNAQIQEIKDKSVELRLLRGAKDVTIQIAPRKSQEAAFTDKAITYWDVKNCQRCHSNPWADPHASLAQRLNADQSVWTDGTTIRLWNHALGTVQTPPAATAAPQEQVNMLKSQLAEMQKTLSALETSLEPAEPKREENK